jgi:hypothetical protein
VEVTQVDCVGREQQRLGANPEPPLLFKVEWKDEQKWVVRKEENQKPG